MMREHPISKAVLGNVLTRSPSDVESRGSTWERASDEYCVGFVAEFGGVDAAYQTPAVVEMQRRGNQQVATLTATVARFSTAAAEQTTELIGLTKQSGEQTDKIVGLTQQLKTLTVVLAVLTLFQVLFGGIQTAAILVAWLTRGT